MIRSMTGYGSAETELMGQRLTAQIQSVNHRYCEVSVRLPRTLSPFENPLRSLLSRLFERGKILFQVSWQGREEPGGHTRLDADRVRQYMEEIRSLKQQLKIPGEADLATLLALPDVWVHDVEELDESETWTVLERVAREAADDLRTMRETEGKSLAIEFEQRLAGAESMIARAEERNQSRPADLKAKLLARLRPLLDGIDVDPARLAQEVALAADRLDYTEECVRSRTHIAQFRALIAGPDPVGRKLNFLLQEMNREANTLGSKCNDAELAGLVVDLKNELEKIREQVQNVE